jgi:predicted Fe-Mo cluster-binding NifX family protein
VDQVKVAICAREEGLNAVVDERFGRCAYFVIVDSDSNELLQSVRNGYAEATGGAGPQAAQQLSALGVDAVVVGNVGPNAIAALEAAKVRVYGGIEGTVEETMQKFKENRLAPVAGATVPSHSGLKE